MRQKYPLSGSTSTTLLCVLNHFFLGYDLTAYTWKHYPKSQKYISLFPPEIRKGTTAPSQGEAATTAKAREEIRSWIQLCMGKGELSVEPELHMDSRSDAKQVMESSNRAVRKQRNGLKNSFRPVDDLVEDDAFFEDDNENSS